MKPFPLAPGKTFLDELEAQLEGYSRPELARVFGSDTSSQAFLAALRYADTRRFLFDSEQAQRFAPLVEFPDKWKDHVREPFPQFYMEFSQPVRLSDGWAVSENDFLRAVLYIPSRPVRVFTGTNPLLVGGPPIIDTKDGSHLILFFHDPTVDMYTDRVFVVNLRRGECYVSRPESERMFEWRNGGMTEDLIKKLTEDAVYGKAKEVMNTLIAKGGTEAMSAADIASMRDDLIPIFAHDASTGLERIPADRQVCFVAGDFAEGRNVGWWERQAMAATAFFSWCLSYMMAKGIKIEIRDISRQQKRWLQRHSKPFPKPWHVVIVDPRYVRNLEEERQEASYRHSYRYDVMGHLRVGRHRIGSKKEDGTYDYRQILEWVPDHQRGLANEVYIPATRVVKAGRKIPPEVRGAQIDG